MKEINKRDMMLIGIIIVIVLIATIMIVIPKGNNKNNLENNEVNGFVDEYNLLGLPTVQFPNNQDTQYNNVPTKIVETP